MSLRTLGLIAGLLLIATPAFATFPTVATTTSGDTGGAVTTITISYPASCCAAGERILACVNMDGNQTGTWPAGFNAIVAQTHAANDVRLECRDLIATGSEGASFDVTVGVGVSAVWRTYRMTGGHASSVMEGASFEGSGTTNDPPNISPSWGSGDNLWFVIGAEQCEPTITFPSNYVTNGINVQYTACGVFVGIASSYRTNTAASEDPDAFTWGSSNHSISATLALRPSAGTRQRCIGCGTDKKVIGDR